MIKVYSFKTGDGQLFETREGALKHELKISAQKLMRAKNPNCGVSIPVPDIAKTITDSVEEFADMINVYRRKMAAIRGHQNRAQKSLNEVIQVG